jgi:hypothetical protein
LRGAGLFIQESVSVLPFAFDGGNYRIKSKRSREEFSESKKIEKSNDFKEIKEIKKFK